MIVDGVWIQGDCAGVLHGFDVAVDPKDPDRILFAARNRLYLSIDVVRAFVREPDEPVDPQATVAAQAAYQDLVEEATDKVLDPDDVAEMGAYATAFPGGLPVDAANAARMQRSCHRLALPGPLLTNGELAKLAGSGGEGILDPRRLSLLYPVGEDGAPTPCGSAPVRVAV